MTFNKTIQMCIFDGNPNGRIMCELSNWNGRVYKISRNDLNEFSNRSDSEFTGVYFLFGKDEENNDTVYVGEAEKMLVRLKQHLKDHNYWNDCVVVISKDNILNKAHVKFLENKFYNLANDAKRATITYGRRVELFRGLGLLAEHSAEETYSSPVISKVNSLTPERTASSSVSSSGAVCVSSLPDTISVTESLLIFFSIVIF